MGVRARVSHVRALGGVGGEAVGGVSLRVADRFSLGFARVHEVHGVSGGDEQHGDEDQDAKVLRLRCRDHHDEVEEVHEVVHGALHPVHHPSCVEKIENSAALQPSAEAASRSIAKIKT